MPDSRARYERHARELVTAHEAETGAPLDPDVRRQLVEQVFGRKPRLNAKARAYRLSAGMAGVVAVGTELTLIYA
jgi:hypothetical protein